jgi:hypothetical protein
VINNFTHNNSILQSVQYIFYLNNTFFVYGDIAKPSVLKLLVIKDLGQMIFLTHLKSFVDKSLRQGKIFSISSLYV